MKMFGVLLRGAYRPLRACAYVSGGRDATFSVCHTASPGKRRPPKAPASVRVPFLRFYPPREATTSLW